MAVPYPNNSAADLVLHPPHRRLLLHAPISSLACVSCGPIVSTPASPRASSYAPSPSPVSPPVAPSPPSPWTPRAAPASLVGDSSRGPIVSLAIISSCVPPSPAPATLPHHLSWMAASASKVEGRRRTQGRRPLRPPTRWTTAATPKVKGYRGCLRRWTTAAAVRWMTTTDTTALTPIISPLNSSSESSKY
ncbi:hypothetical protein BS78_05G069700 [Paspalum vaginatum]|nr:hypothetical protein BS78_05G069700 [Paspalum vaginatum]